MAYGTHNLMNRKDGLEKSVPLEKQVKFSTGLACFFRFTYYLLKFYDYFCQYLCYILQTSSYGNYGGNQMMQQQPMQDHSGSYNQHYANQGQGGMMQPMSGAPQPGGYMQQQHRPMAATAR